MNSFQWFFYCLNKWNKFIFSYSVFTSFCFFSTSQLKSTHLIPASSSAFFNIAVYNYKWFFIIIIYSLIYVQFDFFSSSICRPPRPRNHWNTTSSPSNSAFLSHTTIGRQAASRPTAKPIMYAYQTSDYSEVKNMEKRVQFRT